MLRNAKVRSPIMPPELDPNEQQHKLRVVQAPVHPQVKVQTIVEVGEFTDAGGG